MARDRGQSGPDFSLADKQAGILQRAGMDEAISLCSYHRYHLAPAGGRTGSPDENRQYERGTHAGLRRFSSLLQVDRFNARGLDYFRRRSKTLDPLAVQDSYGRDRSRREGLSESQRSRSEGP